VWISTLLIRGRISPTLVLTATIPFHIADTGADFSDSGSDSDD
jgi:hypothetical protein